MQGLERARVVISQRRHLRHAAVTICQHIAILASFGNQLGLTHTIQTGTRGIYQPIQVAILVSKSQDRICSPRRVVFR